MCNRSADHLAQHEKKVAAVESIVTVKTQHTVNVNELLNVIIRANDILNFLSIFEYNLTRSHSNNNIKKQKPSFC